MRGKTPHPALSPEGRGREVFSRPRGEGKTSEGGYTLVEIVVVLVILALAMGVVVPAVGRSVEGIRLRAEVAGVASFLRSAREQAITQRKPYAVRVDPQTGLLVLTTGTDAVKASRSLRAAVRLEGTQAISFLPQGLSSGGRLRVGSPGYLITVDPLTGRVTAQRVEG